jgi:hypothetical protein
MCYRILATVMVGMLAVLATIAPQTAPAETISQNIPAEAGALFEYLKAGSYKKFAAKESAPHPSAGPHTQVELPVRVYMNAALDASLKAGGGTHKKGSGVVKEMFTSKGVLQGWAVAVKTDAESNDGNGWYWYEVTSTTDGSNPVAAGKGVALCTSCHAVGTDFVLSEYPLK